MTGEGGWQLAPRLGDREVSRGAAPTPSSGRGERQKPAFLCRLTRLWKMTCYSRRRLAAPCSFHSRRKVPLSFPQRSASLRPPSDGRQAGRWRPWPLAVCAVWLRPALWAASALSSSSSSESGMMFALTGASGDSHFTAEDAGAERQGGPPREAGQGTQSRAPASSVPLDWLVPSLSGPLFPSLCRGAEERRVLGGHLFHPSLHQPSRRWGN